MQQRTSDIVKRSRERRVKRQARRGVVLVITIGVLLAIGIGASHYHTFLIQNVDVTGNKTVSMQLIAEATDRVLDQKHFFVLPKRNKWLYPKDELAATLAAEFPRLAAIDLERSSSTLSVAVVEREGVALWCVSASRCYFADDAGYVFVEAPEFTGNPFFIINAALVGDPIGQQPLPAPAFRSLLELASSTEAALRPSLGPAVRAIQANRAAAEDWELLIRRGSAQFVVYFDLNHARDAALNLAAALQTEAWRSAVAGNNKLEYIDLRFPPRVLYKFSEE